MRRHIRFFPVVSASAMLLIACDGSEPLDPTAPNEMIAMAAAKGGSDLAPPSSANATASSTSQIDITWQDNSSNETSFEIHRSTGGESGTFALLTAVGPGATAHNDQGLAAGTQYCYRVRALRSTGIKMTYSAFSNTACAVTLPNPPPPPTDAPGAASGTTATPENSNDVHLEWIDNSTNEDGFRVHRLTDGGAAWSVIGIAERNVTYFYDLGRPSEQQVCYQVVAFNAVGDAPASNMACTTPPAAPTTVTARNVNDTHVEVTWTDNSAVEDAYEVVRRYWFGCGGDPFHAGCTFEDEVVAVLAANSTSYRAPLAEWWGFYLITALKDGGRSDAAQAENIYSWN